MIVADQIYRDDLSGTLSILGIRTVIGATSLPLHHPGLIVYAALVEGRGSIVFELRFVDIDEEREPIYSIDADVTFRDPLTAVELIFEMNDLVFPEKGEYRVQLLVNGQLLRERRLTVLPLNTNRGETS